MPTKAAATPTDTSAPVRPKRGIIALLDSLGTRTGTMEQAISYVETLELLQRDVETTLTVYLENHPKETLQFYQDLDIRFFGDAVLLIYETRPDEPLARYLDYMFPVLNYLTVTALQAGILFRGALSIGDYIHHENVVLGPAVTDAANWYDRFDFIGTAATPGATAKMRFAYVERGDPPNARMASVFDTILYDVPVKGGQTEQLYTANWPHYIGQGDSLKNDTRDWIKTYYKLFEKFPIPIGTEAKFRNTDAFVRFSLSEYLGRSLPWPPLRA